MSLPNNNDEVAPDLPEMRSVLIRSAPTAPMMPMARQFTKEPVLKSAPVLVKSTEANTNNGSWAPSHVPKLPTMYPLGRSHIKVKEAEPSKVCHRIAECLRKESLAATFDENKAIVETPCHTQFYVKVFEDDDMFVVEVQRRTGCSVACHHFTRAVLRAAKGMSAPKPRRTFTIPASVIKMEEEKKETESDLQNAIRLLKEDKLDSQQLGMQALLSLSRKQNVSLDESAVSLILNYVKPQQEDIEREDESFVSVVRHDALRVLANCLNNHSIECKQVTDDVIQVLIADLTHEDLHVAHDAAQCITAICKCCPELKSIVKTFGVNAAAEAAYKEGQARHEKLQREVRLLQLELEG